MNALTQPSAEDARLRHVWYENPKFTAPAQGLYSHVGSFRNGRIAFIAGQLSVDMNETIVGVGDFKAQFHQVFSNLNDVLKGLEVDFNSVVKFTTLFTDPDHIPIFMEERKALFPTIFEGPLYPPNTIMVIKRLVKPEFLIELEAIVSIAE